MHIFSTIMDKIFYHPAAAQAAGTGGGNGTTGQPPSDLSSSSAASPLIATAEKMASDIMSSPASKPPIPSAPSAATPSGTPVNVEVGAVLSAIAQEKGGGGDYQHSILDLLKLLDLDSSLDALDQLAQELNVHTGADGSAEQNSALHKAVMQKLTENGGHVSETMRA